MNRPILGTILLGCALCGVVALAWSVLVRADASRAYDTALVLAVDVSGSVDQSRYRVQMEGIARALEDPDVIRSILGGEHGAMLIALLAWSDGSQVAMPWRSIASEAEALSVARTIRALPHTTGEFTCLARMLRDVRQGLVAEVPANVARIVVDVSGDGPDNCSGARATEEQRDRLVEAGATINGLPIRSGNDVIGTGAYRAPGYGWEELKQDPLVEGVSIETWYQAHVMGGPSAFLVPANGYDDFGRAFRKKFITEISGGPGADGDREDLAAPDARARTGGIAREGAAVGPRDPIRNESSLDRSSRRRS